jgi:hypothetical protein
VLRNFKGRHLEENQPQVAARHPMSQSRNPRAAVRLSPHCSRTALISTISRCTENAELYGLLLVLVVYVHVPRFQPWPSASPKRWLVERLAACANIVPGFGLHLPLARSECGARFRIAVADPENPRCGLPAARSAHPRSCIRMRCRRSSRCRSRRVRRTISAWLSRPYTGAPV